MELPFFVIVEGRKISLCDELRAMTNKEASEWYLLAMEIFLRFGRLMMEEYFWV